MSITVLNAGVIDADPDTFSADVQPVPGETKNVNLTITTSAARTGSQMDITGTDSDADDIAETTIDISDAKATPVETVMKFAAINAAAIVVRGMTNGDTVTITHPDQPDHGVPQGLHSIEVGITV